MDVPCAAGVVVQIVAGQVGTVDDWEIVPDLVMEALAGQDAVVDDACPVAAQVEVVGTAETLSDSEEVDCSVDVVVASVPQVYQSPSPPKHALAVYLFDACWLSFQNRQSPYLLYHLETKQAGLARRQLLY